ncbi:MAG: hypothetical protein V3W41_00645 [Planctomycetota bacterium]
MSLRTGQWLAVVLLTLLSLTACHSAVDASAEGPAELGVIQQSLTRIVAEADANTRVSWVHGWGGNGDVKNCQDGSVMGYCWQWQELIYQRVGPEVRRVGWEAARININNDWFSEHHAVVVFDPKIISRDKLLGSPDLNGWVLDPWLHGKPEIYRLQDWLGSPVIVFESAALE